MYFGEDRFHCAAIVIECQSMTKRRLNHQQRRRIDAQQSRRGKTASRDAEPSMTGEECHGLVVCHYGQQLDVEASDGDQQGQVVRCFQRANLPPLVTGDQVVWQSDGEGGGVILAQRPRHSAMSRPNNRGELRAIAANVDCVVVVIAPVPEPFGNLIDRYLVAIEHLDLQPLILLNKSDLLESSGTSANVSALLAHYQQIGYPTQLVSSRRESDMEALRQRLSEHTVVFVGQSGVGKSSLINALRGEESDNLAEVGELSVGHEKGTHTTTATRLYHIPGSGDLIDSPGIREFGLWHIEPHSLAYGYVEFRPHIELCRFRDCLHVHEPGCALLAAVDAGQVSEARLASYHQVLDSLREER